MSIPRIFFAVPLLIAGAALPALTSAPTAAANGAIGMNHETFSVNEATIPVGGTLTFVNDSRWLHVLGSGQKGRIGAVAGAPSMGTRGAHMSQTGDNWTTATWNTPGTYYVTCSLHPEMTMKVVVAG